MAQIKKEKEKSLQSRCISAEYGSGGGGRERKGWRRAECETRTREGERLKREVGVSE